MFSYISCFFEIFKTNRAKTFISPMDARAKLKQQHQKFTKEEIAKHNKCDDCWVIIHGKVYDVTDFLESHPGGGLALSKDGRGGTDCSSAYDRINHSQEADDILDSLLIGEVIIELQEENPEANKEGN